MGAHVPVIDQTDPTNLLSGYEGPRPTVRRKLLGAVLVGLITTGAAFASCVGQSFNRRQANALEGITRKHESMPVVPMTPCVDTRKEQAR